MNTLSIFPLSPQLSKPFPEQREPKILIVISQPAERLLLVKYLSVNNYTVAEATSGKEALGSLDRGLRPDVILVDAGLSPMTCEELIQKIRENWQIDELPILLLTDKELVSEIAVSLKAGANDYVTKLCTKDELLTRIEIHLDLKRLTDESLFEEVSGNLFSVLNLRSSLQELSLYNVQKEMSCLGEELAIAFRENPLLPGAILTEQGKFEGIVSREQFLKVISSPYGKEVFLKSPLRRMHPYVKTEVLVFTSNTLIVVGAKRSLQRSPELLTEPLAVKFPGDTYRLLDVHQLLAAQDHIHRLAMQLIKKQSDKLTEVNKALDYELEKGRQIQNDFLPHEIPNLANWEVATCFYPARQVAGDFYDVFMLPCDCMGLVIADVCDKGVGAALFMALFRSLIRVFSGQTCLGKLSVANDGDSLNSELDASCSPDLEMMNALEAVKLTNNYIAQQHGEMVMFATMFFGVLDPGNGNLLYINGGHDPLFIVGANGVKASLEPTGPAVGMMPDVKFEIKQVQLEPGDILIGYTDGVTEAYNPSGEFFTSERLDSLLEQPASSARELLEQIKTHLFAHVDNAVQSDDITMLAVQRMFCD